LHWAQSFQQPPRRTFLTHGEEEPAQALAKTLRDVHGWEVLIPDYQSVSDLR
jgi:metallo-beta-lactamase family protein